VSVGHCCPDAGDLFLARSLLEEGDLVPLRSKRNEPSSSIIRLPILVFHITAGTLGRLSRLVTVCLRHGSLRHRIAGEVFVISVLTIAVCGVYLAIVKSKRATFPEARWQSTG
jgi:hypothetical protein